MLDIIAKRRWFYLVSLLLTIPGLIFILLTPVSPYGLQFTIDYTGGTRWVVRFEDQNVTPDQVKAVFAAQGLPASVLRTGNGFLEIKTEPIGLKEAPASASPVPTLPAASGSGAPSGSGAASASAAASGSPVASASSSASAAASSSASAAASSAAPSASPVPSGSPVASGSPAASGSAAPSGAAVGASALPSASPPPGNRQIPTEGRLGTIATALQSQFGPIAEQNSLTTIGPVVSADLISQALVLIAVGSLGILLWITFRFRDVKFGVTALVALLHDVIVVVGTFAILGTFLGVQIDALFVTAMLTVIGFSVHDTIVVFDRIRENRARHAGEPFAAIVNHSILQTFGRSVTTSLTVVLTLLALLLFGGAAISDFILALLIGIVSGTYSSIFVASLLLVDWHLWEDRRRGRPVATRTARPRRAAS
ncbi:MAG: protein translocase subunit SecF [Chloroflexota bacterium]